MAMDIKEIMSIIPHRQPFLLIDRVEEIVEGESVTAIKNVTYNEPFFAGHFPNEARKVEKAEYALSNSLGFGGHNAVLCFKKWGE